MGDTDNASTGSSDEIGELVTDDTDYAAEAVKGISDEPADDALDDDNDSVESKGEDSDGGADDGVDGDGKPKRRKLPEYQPKKPKPGDKVTQRVMRRKNERAKLNDAQTQLQQREAQLRQMEQALNSRASEYQRAIAAGDYDAALKAAGIDKSLAEIQRESLMKRAGQSRDPKVLEMEKRLAAYEEAQQRQIQEYQRQQEQLREQQEHSQMLSELAQDIAESDYEGAEDLSKLDGFTSMMSEFMESQDGEELDFDDAFAQTVGVYRDLFTRLKPIFGAEAADLDGDDDDLEAEQAAPEKAPQKPRRRRGKRNSIPQSNSQGARRGKSAPEVTGIHMSPEDMKAIINETNRLFPPDS